MAQSPGCSSELFWFLCGVFFRVFFFSSSVFVGTFSEICLFFVFCKVPVCLE